MAVVQWLADYWEAPRRTWLRRAAFQVHLWAGLAIGLYALAIGVSGSVLVFQNELRAWAEPAVYRVAPSRAQVPLEELRRRASASAEGYRVGGFEFPAEPAEAIYAWTLPLKPGGHLYGPNVYMNQHTGGVLGVRDPYAGFLGWMARLHYFLLAGETGEKVNGALAAVLLLLCLTGLVAWWPGRAHWRRGLSLRLRARWKRVNYDLHTTGGFWLSAVLLAMSFTGVFFVYPVPVAAAMAKLTRTPMQRLTWLLNYPPSKASEGPPAALDAAFASAAARMGADCRPKYLILPADAKGSITLVAEHAGWALLAGRIQIHVDQYTGEVLKVVDSREQGALAAIIIAFYPLHFGQWGGLPAKLLWVLMGLTPGVLFATGFVMWWNRVLRKRLSAWPASNRTP